MTAAGVARSQAGRPRSPSAPPPPPALAVGRGRASCLTSVRGSEDGCGAEHRAVAAAAAAGGERSGRGLRFARGALSRGARRRPGREAGLGERSTRPLRQPQHHGHRGGRTQRETAVEREKGGKVGARTPGGSRPCPRNPVKGPRPPSGAGAGRPRAGAGSWTSRGSHSSPGSGVSAPWPEGPGRCSRACLLCDPAAPRPVTAAELGDRGRGRGGGDFWKTEAARALPVRTGEGAGPRAGLLVRLTG